MGSCKSGKYSRCNPEIEHLGSRIYGITQTGSDIDNRRYYSNKSDSGFAKAFTFAELMMEPTSLNDSYDKENHQDYEGKESGVPLTYFFF